MATVNIADAKAHLSELVGQVEAGETMDFLRRGKLVARMVPAETPRKPIDIEALRKLTQGLPVQAESQGIPRLRPRCILFKGVQISASSCQSSE
ncbi:type II toxin-antitoxin system Phd/YefM family antitoxin [Phyllobacterium endophyticum]|uniref:Antitoxin n=1 Tax=Phyllobacterium endophyticum TaxID=1149773 RepID=A0A2P7AVU5_9HYPH|nr:type II toxin-antitoxin system Phd/YefM family antitoxin [Phyllobacterium endophyticum]MBB3234924.1 antitoxin (DNA-binding transcriptional repressor) of toxin-antitoxin stability system [Phyllobacterium endophyticum]PSH58338.1 type II toxin-antitoxin system prevent-host-death family antitoxin [Phyllobacterium endophyticum]TYR39024.1 type II toxin-antitoxin system prevent-host-death family antitoxin [Phyllobacterium endophyticum]